MNDDDPTLTPEQERQVRRLLADARHTEPVPGDVAARLDRVLAGLARSESADPTPVTVLASRRRRRVVSMLVAAAAVVAVGVGLGQVVGSGTDGSDDSPSATSAERGGPDQVGPTAADRDGQESAGAGQEAPGFVVAEPIVIRPDAFSAEATRLQVRAAKSERSTSAFSANGSLATDGISPLTDFDCTFGDWGAGAFVPVLYDGDPGVLVFREVNGDTQVVDLFLCGSEDALRSITLPAP